MVRIAAPLLCVASLILAGCAAVGPDYHLPAKALVNAPAAQGNFASANSAVVSTDPPDRWWKLYDDAQLDALVEKSLAANTDLRVAEANLERTQALLAAARTNRQPSVAIDASDSWTRPSGEQVLQRVAERPRDAYNLGIGVSYDPDLFGAIRRGIEAATDDRDATIAARDLVKIIVVAETARAYADICNAGHEMAALNRVIGVQQAGLELTNSLVAAGRAAPHDRDRQQAALEAARARLPGLVARQRNAAYRLATLQGSPPESYDPALLDCAHPLQTGRPLPVGDGQALLARRPDVRAMERRLAAATARIGVATAELYPDIRLVAGIGSTGAAPDFLTTFTNRYAIGPVLHWNLNRSAVRARIAAANASSKAALAAFDGTVLRALRETETAIETYGAGLQSLARLNAARANSERVEQQLLDLRRAGRASGLELVDAERQSAAAAMAVASAESTVNDAEIAVFLALGGGWASTSTKGDGAIGQRSR